MAVRASSFCRGQISVHLSRRDPSTIYKKRGEKGLRPYDVIQLCGRDECPCRPPSQESCKIPQLSPKFISKTTRILTIQEENVLDNEGNVLVAIKELKPSGKNFAAIAEGEAVVLEMMRGLTDQPHLIKAIAYYQKGDGHYFMFPWAELGDLWEFWKNTTPKTERDYIIWAFTQLTGLARALECLHHRASTSEENYRHGDLKPLNILCFKTKGGQKDKPRLVITDVGLARKHNIATRERQDLALFTYSTAATVTHAAPELGIGPNAPRSRRFDIWSMGCILLEFTIWLLYGPQKLKEFSSCLDGSFYTLETQKKSSKTKGQQNLSPINKSQEEKTAKVHTEVGVWIRYIKADWRCSEGTAVRRLVELIETRLLIVELGIQNPVNDRSSLISPIKEEASASQQSSPIFGETLTLEPGSTSQPSITTTSVGELDTAFQKATSEITPPPRQNTALLSLMDPDPKFRAYAPEMRKELELILTCLNHEQIKPIGSPPSSGAAPPLGPSRVQFTKQNRHLGGLNTRVR
jgi:serine/threonine protein kinase